MGKMKLFLVGILLACAAVAVQTYNVVPSRRQLLIQASFCAATMLPPLAAQAIQACERSTNCIRTVWIPPEGTTQAEIAQTIRAALSSYPQEGTSYKEDTKYHSCKL